MNHPFPLYLLIASLALAAAIIRMKQIPFLSPYGIFLIFQCLYNIVPWFAGPRFGEAPGSIHTMLILSATANIAFVVAIAVFYRHYDFKALEPATKRKRRRYVLICLPIFLLSAVLCHFWGWHVFASVASASGANWMTRITSYVKEFCIATYLYYVCTYAVDRYAGLLFSGLMIIMVIDGARTNFFPVIVVTLMLWQATSKVAGWKIWLGFLTGVVGIVAIRGILIGATGIGIVLGGVVLEGCMGSFSSTQSIFAIQHMLNPPYTLGIRPLSVWSSKIYPWIRGDFAPLGGYYYVAGTVADFGYLGPALETFCFGWLLCHSERWKQTRPLIYFAFMSTLGILFAKVTLANGLKLLAAQLFFLGMIVSVRKNKRFLAAPPPEVKFQTLNDHD